MQSSFFIKVACDLEKFVIKVWKKTNRKNVFGDSLKCYSAFRAISCIAVPLHVVSIDFTVDHVTTELHDVVQFRSSFKQVRQTDRLVKEEADDSETDLSALDTVV